METRRRGHKAGRSSHTYSFHPKEMFGLFVVVFSACLSFVFVAPVRTCVINRSEMLL